MAEQYKEQHRRWYAEWIRRQYSGPGCRAKIVGRTKYEQIVRAVRGELRRAAENSKFRFWVRAKGFRMGRPATAAAAAQVDDANALYVVDPRNRSSAAATGGGGSRQQNCPMYKKVAVVDEFFDIIYRVHCSGGGVSARHSGQKRTHRMIMETYAFLPREAVTAFLMGCPQCTTNTASPSANADNNMLADNTQQVPHPPLQSISTSGFYCGVSVENWSASFACSTPVKSDGENYCTSTTDSAAESNRTAKIAIAVVTMGADKENVMDNNDADAVSAVSATDNRNKRKRTVPLKRDTRHRSVCRVVATDASVVLSNSSTGSSTLRNSSSSTLILSSSSSSYGRTDNSAGVSKSSGGGWWSKWGVRSRGSTRFSTSSDLSGSAGQPLDLSSSPLLAISPAPSKVRFDDFFYKRRRVRRRRKPKRLHRPDFGGGHRAGDRYGDFGDDETSDSDSDANGPDAEEPNAGNTKGDDGGGDDGDDGDDDGPRPAKMKRMTWAANMAADVTKTRAEYSAGSDGTTTAGLDNGLDENREKSAAMHLPINKRMNGGSHPYHTMHHNARSILNGLATSSSSPSTLSKSLDTITSSSASHHNFHRHWLDMANESVTNSSLMDVDGSTEDNSMAAAAAAAAAALLFSPPSSVGGGISPGGPLSSLNPNSHLAHHHGLSPLAPPPHSANSVGLAPAHHHHHQHIQQQLQQYAAAAVAAATAAAAAAAAASSAGDSTSPPPNLPLTLPPMAHHYNQNNNITGSNKRRSGGTGLTVQQQLYRRAGTPTSSTTSSPSPRLLNSKNDADTTTSGLGLHENGNFSTSGLPTTTTTVLWPPLGLLTAAHHHNMSSPPKFQELFGSTVNTLAAVTSGSQVLPTLPPPPISSPSSSYRQASKETNGMQTSNVNVTGTDIGIGTSTGNTTNADEEDPAIDDDDDEEDEEDEEEEEEDLDDDEMEEGEEYGDEEEEGERAMSGGDGSGAQTRRLRRQQVRRLRQLQGAGDRNASNSQNDGTESGLTSNYHQNWQQPSNSTTSAMSISKQQHQQSIGSSSQQHIDPERLKAFNMFVRLFVDENLDRQVPISRQPKDKVQAIIDSCGRQFPELSDRSRKRIRTYLKSCRRNKRNTPQSGGAASSSPPPAANPWPSNGSSSDPNGQPQRPTPAHLTSAQAETILAVACQRESDNARRMRLGLEPVAQPYPYAMTPTSGANAFQQPPGSLLQLSQNGNGGGTMQMSSTSSDDDAGVGDSSFDKSSCNAVDADTAEHRNDNDEPDNPDGGRDRREGSVSAAGDPAAANTSLAEEPNAGIATCGATVTSSCPSNNNNETAGPTDLSVNKSSATTNTPGSTPMTSALPTAIGSGGGYMQSGTGTGFKSLSSSTYTTTVNHRRMSSNNSNNNNSNNNGTSNPTGMLQLFPTMTTASGVSGGTPATLPLQPLLAQTTPPAQPSSKLLNKADVVTVRQLIAGYRESAAFLLRSADELEHLLLLRG